MNNSKSLIKTILIASIIVCYGNIVAQSSSNNFYFCALNGTCFNEANSNNPQVSLIQVEYSPQEMIDVTETFMENHPEYTLVAPASLLYNCHGFAYSVFQGGEKCQITWDESLCTSNGSSLASYIEILASEAQPDDIVTAVEQESWGDLVSRHSAIVINEDTLLSKWGNFPLFKHHKNDPWLSGQIGLTNNVSHYVYYRRNSRFGQPLHGGLQQHS